MNLVIKQEEINEREIVEDVVRKAFLNAEFSDKSEHILVKKLRESKEFISELSLVAKVEDSVIGHILYTKIHIYEGDKRYESLALAPLSVLPEYQNMGVGSKLIKSSIEIAKRLGYTSVVVLGHEHYYSKFGFKPSYLFDIKAPFDVPKEAYMVLELEEGALKNISGVVEYSKAFFE